MVLRVPSRAKYVVGLFDVARRLNEATGIEHPKEKSSISSIDGFKTIQRAQV